MWGISIRRLIGLLRKRRPEPVADRDQPAALVASVEELVLAGTEHGDLAGVLRSLSPELRAVVQATVLDGLTTREAGAAARHPGRHGEDTDDAGTCGDERSAGMSWHVDAVTANRYASRRIDPTTAASVESHMMECSGCRALVGEAVDGPCWAPCGRR